MGGVQFGAHIIDKKKTPPTGDLVGDLSLRQCQRARYNLCLAPGEGGGGWTTADIQVEIAPMGIRNA